MGQRWTALKDLAVTKSFLRNIDIFIVYIMQKLNFIIVFTYRWRLLDSISM